MALCTVHVTQLPPYCRVCKALYILCCYVSDALLLHQGLCIMHHILGPAGVVTSSERVQYYNARRRCSASVHEEQRMYLSRAFAVRRYRKADAQISDQIDNSPQVPSQQEHAREHKREHNSPSRNDACGSSMYWLGPGLTHFYRGPRRCAAALGTLGLRYRLTTIVALP
jgi:hypothetical protein